MNLKEQYNNLLVDGHPFYYDDFDFEGSCLSDATRFLDAYFRHAGKPPLAEFNCYTLDDNEREIRNKHMVSTYLLGYLIAEKLHLEDDLYIVNTGCPFKYVWYLICLFHDAGYGLERNEQELNALRKALSQKKTEKEKPFRLGRSVIYDFKKRQKIHSSIWNGHSKFYYRNYRRWRMTAHRNVQIEENNDKEILVSQYYCDNKFVDFANGIRCNYPTHTSALINNYFEFRLSDGKGCIDHGIAGGYIFFDTMIKNYIYCYNEACREADCSFDDFIYKNKHYCLDQFSVFGYIADCIISHNIWNGKGKEETYRRFNLEDLTGDKYIKADKRNNPYLFLLALSDMLEPFKIFRKFNGTEKQLLSQIDFEVTANSIIISSNNDEIYSAYRQKINGSEDWINVNVQVDDDKNKIIMTF